MVVNVAVVWIRWVTVMYQRNVWFLVVLTGRITVILSLFGAIFQVCNVNCEDLQDIDAGDLYSIKYSQDYWYVCLLGLLLID